MRKYILIFFALFLALCMRADALTLLNAGYNMSSYPETYYGLTISALGGAVSQPCNCQWWDVWCWLTCRQNYTESGCFGNNHAQFLENYSNMSGIGYFNNSCDINPDYQSIAIYAHDSNSPYGTVIVTPNKRTTLFAQAKYNVNNWTGLNLSLGYPFLAFVDPNNISTYYAVANLTINASSWQVTTVWYTFNASSNVTALIIIPEVDGMSKGWSIFFDYFRVGYVDMDRYVFSQPSISKMREDCAWSNGTSAGCSLINKTFNGTYVGQDSIFFTLNGMSLGEDPNVPCEAFYINWTDIEPEYFTGRYAVRIPDSMPPFSNSVDIGSYTQDGGITKWDSWCNLWFKDFFYHYNDVTVMNTFENYIITETSIGFIDFVNMTFALPTWFYAYSSCSGNCGGVQHSPCTGYMQFNDSGIIKNITECNVSYSSYANGKKYYRYPLNLSNYNITNSSAWRIYQFKTYESTHYPIFPWTPMDYFITMFNATCTDISGWYCENNTEFYLYPNCMIGLNASCGYCGCNNATNRCAVGFDYWECADNTTAVHWNTSCLQDRSVTCEFECLNDKCVAQNPCETNYTCHDYCDVDSSRVYTDPYCDNATGLCNWLSYEDCFYGCNNIFNACNPRPVFEYAVNITSQTIGLSATDTQTFIALMTSLILSALLTYFISYRGGFGDSSIVFGISFLGILSLFALWNPPWIDILVYVIILILTGVVMIWKVRR